MLSLQVRNTTAFAAMTTCAQRKGPSAGTKPARSGPGQGRPKAPGTKPPARRLPPQPPTPDMPLPPSQGARPASNRRKRTPEVPVSSEEQAFGPPQKLTPGDLRRLVVRAILERAALDVRKSARPLGFAGLALVTTSIFETSLVGGVLAMHFTPDRAQGLLTTSAVTAAATIGLLWATFTSFVKVMEKPPAAGKPPEGDV